MIRIKLIMPRKSTELEIKKNYWIAKVLMSQVSRELTAGKKLFPFLLRNSLEITTHFLM